MYGVHIQLHVGAVGGLARCGCSLCEVPSWMWVQWVTALLENLDPASPSRALRPLLESTHRATSFACPVQLFQKGHLASALLDSDPGVAPSPTPQLGDFQASGRRPKPYAIFRKPSWFYITPSESTGSLPLGCRSILRSCTHPYMPPDPPRGGGRHV